MVWGFFVCLFVCFGGVFWGDGGGGGLIKKQEGKNFNFDSSHWDAYELVYFHSGVMIDTTGL